MYKNIQDIMDEINNIGIKEKHDRDNLLRVLEDTQELLESNESTIKCLTTTADVFQEEKNKYKCEAEELRKEKLMLEKEKNELIAELESIRKLIDRKENLVSEYEGRIEKLRDVLVNAVYRI